ncbi:solute carrier family 2, facilitated glucose transporter member 11-like isoform X2 [Pelodiscus sinensis]|uniref:solute carrier family 2, facilitated glucose transporter member 11-like isoform X2 n=1 Tax=Pelodiscus sinensis TaxID=13735 RepID=UPI000703C882|nr:solute carrier family 2, facilitated glucose transporter member 11-like isoform X2 [Pelodiscus sinensis]|eukprot:XP_014427275.1 solute carrier family 2, facilitated glucose transporter member 11-like isoform X2 [Pelodiscus sinensis]
MECQPLLKGHRSPRKLPSWTLVLAVCAVGIGGTFQYGYNVSIINAPTVHIHKFLNETWSSRYQTELNTSLLTLLWSVIASIFSLGGLCGAHIGGSMAIKLGRKGALLVNNFIAILASILMGISFPTGLFELLMVGRFLIGVNTGIGLCVQPLYIGEIAPKHLRGTMAMGSSIFLTGGILTGQIIGLRELLGGEKYWPILLSSSCIPALAQLLFLPWFPESPRYLLIDRQDEMKCTKALKCFHGPLHYQAEMEDIQREHLVLNGEKPKKPWQLFGDRSVKWQLITVIVMAMGQQLSGINAIYFYASYIFKQAGIPAEKISYVTLGTGACECLTALTCGLLIDYLGRRFLIIGGYTLMSFWCIVLTFSLTYQELYPWVPYLSMASIFAFILSFGLGPGGITNTLTAELFTQSSRPAAYMIGGSVSWLSFFTIGMIFPFIVNGLKQYCFVVFLLESLLVAIFIFFVIPETKNKSFLEIKQEFQQLNFRGRVKEKEAELYERRQLCNEF